MSSAQKIVQLAQSWVGKNKADGSYKEIIDIYNAQVPLPVGYKVKYTDQWCATTVSALAVSLGYTDIIPPECSCPRMITLFQKIGSWDENDARVPNPGDIIFYNWQASTTGDDRGGADHVGIVEKCQNGEITVIEGNYHNAVSRRHIKVDDRYIRGFGVPKYTENESSEGWNNDGSGWYYVENGERKKNAWVEDSTDWCYLGEDGYAVTDRWINHEDFWYYMGEDCHMVRSEWRKDSTDWCYVDEEGKMLTNAWVKDSEGWCFVINDGHVLRNGYANDSNGRQYIDETGHMVI